MRLIKPSQISGEIMTIIEEADKELVIVSPYYKISKWYKLLKRLDHLKNKNIDVKIFVRENEVESINEVQNQGFIPFPIPNLHTKLYMNEKNAIVSSMNLNLSSDTNSIDIAMITENRKEYEELYEYYERYIKDEAETAQGRKGHKQQNVSQVNNTNLNENRYYDWRRDLDEKLFVALGRSAHIKEYEGKLEIRSTNRYEAFIDNGGSNSLRVFGILSGKEYNVANGSKNIFQSRIMKVELIEGRQGHYDTIWGSISNLKSWTINQLCNGEEPLVVDSIVQFICGVEELKDFVRNN